MTRRLAVKLLVLRPNGFSVNEFHVNRAGDACYFLYKGDTLVRITNNEYVLTFYEVVDILQKDVPKVITL